jgi:signal transduction histidine kinase
MLHDTGEAALTSLLPADVRAEVRGAGATLRTLGPGEVLFAEGGAELDLFLVLEGEVRVTQGQGRAPGAERLLAVHQAGDFTGVFSLLSGGPALATARAVGDALVLRVPGEEFRRRLATCSPLARFVLTAVASRALDAEAQARQQAPLAVLGRVATGLAEQLATPVATTRRAGAELARLAAAAHGRALAQGATLGAAGGLEALRAEAGRAEAGRAEAGRAEAGRVEAGRAEAGRAAEGEGAAAQGDRPQGPAAEAWLADARALRRLAAEVEAGTERVSALLSAVLDAPPGTLGAGGEEAARALREVDVHEGLESSLAILGPRLRSQRVTVLRDYEAELPPVRVHDTELHQVWTILVGNALDAMAGPGQLRLSTCRRGDELHVEVGDDGPSLPPESLPRLFGGRGGGAGAHGAGRGGQGGRAREVGPGLDVVRRIVEQRHGGRVHVCSRPGDTRFRVELPMRRPDAH